MHLRYFFLLIFLSGCQSVPIKNEKITVPIMAEGEVVGHIEVPEGEDPDEYIWRLISALPEGIPSSRASLKASKEELVCNESYEFFVEPSLIEKADAGDGEAQWKMALAHYDQSSCYAPPKALAWIELAAQNGSIDAAAEQGAFYLFGASGFQKNTELANYWLDKAIAAGDALAQYNKTFTYRVSNDGLPDDEAITSSLKKAYDLGSREAGFELGYRCFEGFLHNVKREECISFIKTALIDGDTYETHFNNLLARQEDLLLPAEWAINSDVFTNYQKGAKHPEFGEIFPKALYRIGHGLVEKKVDLHDLVPISESEFEESDLDQIRSRYGVNFLMVSAHFGFPEAQETMVSLMLKLQDRQRAKYWADRLERNLNGM